VEAMYQNPARNPKKSVLMIGFVAFLCALSAKFASSCLPTMNEELIVSICVLWIGYEW